MGGEPDDSTIPPAIDDVDLTDADAARVDYLSRESSGLSDDEAERIVRFARVPRGRRDPSMLRLSHVDSKASRDGTSGSGSATSNGSADVVDLPTAGDTPESGTNSAGKTLQFCRTVRKRMRAADRTAEVIEDYPDKHPSAIFRHAEGRCACDTDVDPTTSPRVQADECLDMRRAFRKGATKRDVMSDFSRSANAVNKHLFGRCDHPLRRGNPVTERMKTAECAHLREAYRRNETVSVHNLAAAYGISSSTAHKHLRDKCDHDVDADPIPPVEITAETCAGMRRDYNRDPRAVVARVARDHDTTRPTADYHIFGRCDCDADEDAAKRR